MALLLSYVYRMRHPHCFRQTVVSSESAVSATKPKIKLSPLSISMGVRCDALSATPPCHQGSRTVNKLPQTAGLFGGTNNKHGGDDTPLKKDQSPATATNKTHVLSNITNTSTSPASESERLSKMATPKRKSSLKVSDRLRITAAAVATFSALQH